MRDHFISELTRIAENDKDVILITGDLGFGVLDDFIRKFPNQFINAGVAEQNMTGIATGLSLDGKTVFTYSIGNFNTLRCLEQIRNDACYHDCNLNIISVGGGFSYGALGYSHHATEDIAIMRALPNLRVFCPSDFWEVQEITKKVVEFGGVNYVRIDKSSSNYVNRRNEKLDIGKARILTDGKDISIIATGGIVEIALEAQKKLSKLDIFCKVVSMHTIKPIDKDIIVDVANNTGGIITFEEHSLIGGLGGAVSEVLMQENIYPKKFKMIGLKSRFSTIVGSQSYLRNINNLDVESLICQVQSLLK